MKALAMVLCITMLSLTTAYAFEQDKCISCSDENTELIEMMGYEVTQTEDGMVISDSITGKELLIEPQGNGGLCRAYAFCIFFTFWIAYGIYFLPCLIGYYSSGC